MDTQSAYTFVEGQHASLLNGPMLFGYLSDALLFGVLSVQTYIYFLAFPRDAPMLKSVVYGTYTVGLAQTIFAMIDAYILACIGPNNVTFVVQWLYAYRIYILCRKMILAGSILCLSSLQLVIGGWGSITLIHMASAPQFEWSEIIATDAGYDVNVLAWGVIHVVCNSLIALCMTHPRVLGRQGKAARQSHLIRVIQFVVKTGLLTTIATVFYTVVSIERNTSLYMLSGLSLGKLYSISMMVMVNNRLTIKDGRVLGDPSTLDVPAEFCIVRSPKRLKSAESGLEAGINLERKLEDESYAYGEERSSLDSEKIVLGAEDLVLNANAKSRRG